MVLQCPLKDLVYLSNIIYNVFFYLEHFKPEVLLFKRIQDFFQKGKGKNTGHNAFT